MGKPNIRLNPQLDSIRNRVILEKATKTLLSCALLLPAPDNSGRGRNPYDYRLVLVLCILRILLRKRYADYESEMRTDKRLMEMLSLIKLPCKSTVNNYALFFSLSMLSQFNTRLINYWIKKPVDLLLDASGIRLVGRSIWYCIRTNKKIRKKTRFLLPDAKNSTTISYEAAIFYIIGFVMACIIAFSLGVEKGRHDQLKSEPNLRSKFDTEAALRNASE